MTDDTAHMHYVGKEISPEQFVADHTFLYVIKGMMQGYDGSKQVIVKAGDCVIVRRDRLARYRKEKVDHEIQKIFIFLDEPFLKRFEERYKPVSTRFRQHETIVPLKKNDLLPGFVQSILPYYDRTKIKAPFADVKREELLLILLESQPELAGLFFDYAAPQKINIEEFMNRNFKFNVSVERFAYLTGRSVSAFKRDFNEIYSQTPSRWLIQKRLEEAHFLIEEQKQRPAEIYLDLGFETLQHFSSSFKKKFGITPTALVNGKTKNSR